MNIDESLDPADLLPAIENVFALAARKTLTLARNWVPHRGAPVVTMRGKYVAQGWTEWTQGFQYGSIILAGEGADDDGLIELGREQTLDMMLPHVTHTGVHDHGFNNLSTYGNLLRLMNEGRLAGDRYQRKVYENAIAASGAVQAARWAKTSCDLGYIYSFNGPHSLFIDTMRTLRILVVAHQLGHVLMGENDERINLLSRAIQHALATSRYIVFHGEGVHNYDIRGRTAHEGTFNPNDGKFRSRATQQGYSPFSTWTRGLAWAMLGFAEQLEFLAGVEEDEFTDIGLSKPEVMRELQTSATQTCDHYIHDCSAADGIVYWDDGAPQLHQLGNWRDVPANPTNDYEPVDASAAAIAAQGLIRLGNYLANPEYSALDNTRPGLTYRQAGLTIAKVLFDAPYLSTNENHQWPNRWDHVPPCAKVAHGESSMWGDYHLLELALHIQREAYDRPYLKFFLD